MTLVKAIEILTMLRTESYKYTGADLDDALQLSFEASRQLLWLRETNVLYAKDLLPGETKK